VLKLLPDGSWKSRATLKARGRARLVEHEREGSQAWPHNTHAWGLQISSAFAVHVTAKANSTRLQNLWGNNLNPGAIGQDLKALLWDMDRDNTILEVLDDDENLAFSVLLDELLTNSWEPQLLAIDHNLHGTRNWDHLNLSDSRQDLDNLLLRLNSLGNNRDWDVLGSIQKKDMFTVIDLVVNSHVVKGTDERWFNTASRWHVVTRHPKGSNFHWSAQDGRWENVSKSKCSKAEVPQNNLSGWGMNLDISGQLRSALSTSFNIQKAFSSVVWLFAFNIAKGQKALRNTVQKSHEVSLRPRLWSLEGEVDLVKGGSLTADHGASWGQQFILVLLSHALLELWRLTDLPLQFLSLFKLGNNLEALHLVRLAKENLTLEATPQGFLNQPLNIPPVHDLWDLNLAFIPQSVGLLAIDWRNLNNSHVGLRGGGDARRLLAQNNDGLDLLHLRAGGALGHTSNFNNVGLLQLRQDILDLGELAGDLVLSDHLLGQRVHHTLGGEADNNGELLGLRLSWVQNKGHGGPPDR